MAKFPIVGGTFALGAAILVGSKVRKGKERGGI